MAARSHEPFRNFPPIAMSSGSAWIRSSVSPWWGVSLSNFLDPQDISATGSVRLTPFSDLDLSAASQRASAGRERETTPASSALCLSRSGRAAQSVHRIHACARNRGIQTGGNPGGDRIQAQRAEERPERGYLFADGRSLPNADHPCIRVIVPEKFRGRIFPDPSGRAASTRTLHSGTS